MKMPLSKIRVLDLTRLLPGPFCSMILADMGAEVLKIEEPTIGDTFRSRKPVLKEEGTAFLMLNRNKKSMKLNLQSAEGKGIFMRLVKEYDVILEQFRPGVMERLGVGYEDVKKVNPKVIYCSLTGFGQSGPYRDKAGHDINYLSIAGVLDSIGIKNGPPVIPGIQVADLAGGALWSAIAILIALIGREQTGQGQYLDVAMTDGVIPFLTLFASSFIANGQVPRRGGTVSSGLYACYNVYETQDGRYVSLGAVEGKFWSGFCKAIGRQDLIADHYAADPRRSELIEEVRTIMKTKTQAEWLELMAFEDVCFTPVNSLSDIFNDPHVQARNMVKNIIHPVEGTIPTLAFPVKFSETPAQLYSPPPLFGEHTEEILTHIGYSDTQIAELKKSGVI